MASRDAALWVIDAVADEVGADALAEVMRLPWRLVLNESSESHLRAALEKPEAPNDPLVRRRGFVQLVDTNPSEIQLPPRSLPIFQLNGKEGSTAKGIGALTRRLTMLDSLQQSGVKELVVLLGRNGVMPAELADLWNDGFRTIVTVVSDGPDAVAELEKWRGGRPSGNVAALLALNAKLFCKEIVDRYASQQKDDRVIVRLRSAEGQLSDLDITTLDDPERPVLSNYSLLQVGDLQPVQSSDLSYSEVQHFFSDATASWRPFAAGLPWLADEGAWQRLRARLRRLDRDGSDGNRILYITSESGAGGTTLMRALAWMSASEGYPTLLANDAPLSPKALELVNFMARVLDKRRSATRQIDGERLYETPWLLAFDRQHWQGRENELRQFLREMERSGRPVCILIVTGPYVPTDFYDEHHFLNLANLSHQISLDAAMKLGAHLNPFLAPHGATRSENEWRRFYEASAVQAEKGIAAFWIALSFWVQRQFNMQETIQSWIYRQFKERLHDDQVRGAILDIAALSTERYPLPEILLPRTTDWPVAEKIDDIRRDVPGLAIARISRDGDKYWALAHDIIGRFLTTALFYDTSARVQAGFEAASNPEHLRFHILRRLSQAPALGHIALRSLAEEFAISIFKIDPDHGHANFVQFWREVLSALDGMPKPLRTTSRAFLHHAAISRRRIASQKDTFPMEAGERIAILERAISDLRYALDYIAPTPDGEADLNIYNSLALAYQDLAKEERERGAPNERVIELRALAVQATQRAYQANPSNSFVVETYARNLLAEAQTRPEIAVENAIEVLGIVYAAMDRDRSGQRRFALSKLSDGAIGVLLGAYTPSADIGEVTTEVGALVAAIHALAGGVHRFEGMALSDFPLENRQKAAEGFAHSLLIGNQQAVRLRYELLCLSAPQDFRGQLELLQSLQDSNTVFNAQMRLEMALLLHQCDRHHEGVRLFRDLRRLWREGDYYVEVPERLRWLWSTDGISPRLVTARIASGSDNRGTAKVRELKDSDVPFRSQEFGQQFRPGAQIRGYISFGHNGPFLRPTTAVR
jgi:hypothetical protein